MARYSKQDYEMVAAVLHGHQREFENADGTWKDPSDLYHLGNIAALNELQSEFARRFSRDNGAFDRARFVEACNTGKHIRTSIREG